MPTVRSPVQHAVFDRDGNILAMGFFDEEETGLLQTAVDKVSAIRVHFHDHGDADGLTTKMALWNHPGDSVHGYAARSHRMVDAKNLILNRP